MSRWIDKLTELRSNLAIRDRTRRVYDYLRDRGLLPQARDPHEYLFAYRQLALQISLDNPETGSALLATPVSSRPVAQCGALLAGSLASISKKPVLLVDLSQDGKRLSDLLGLTSEMYYATDESSRFFSVSGRWYISTREGIPAGPYSSAEDAEAALAEFIQTADWTSVLEDESWALSQFVLPTQFQNLFFLPPAAARLALVRGAYLGDQEKNIAGLIEELGEQFGYVLFYGGSTLENSLMLPVIPHVNDVFHAVVEDQTRVKDIDWSMAMLMKYNAGNLASILVRATDTSDKVLVSVK